MKGEGAKDREQKQRRGIVHLYTASVQQIGCTLRDKEKEEGKEEGAYKGQ